MEIPWVWIICMTVYEVCNVLYAFYKLKEGTASLGIGVILGIWSLCLVSWLNLHIAWK